MYKQLSTPWQLVSLRSFTSSCICKPSEWPAAGCNAHAVAMGRVFSIVCQLFSRPWQVVCMTLGFHVFPLSEQILCVLGISICRSNG